MSVLVVPDVHENIDKLEHLLDRAGSHERTIFLGDWFDSFERTELSTRRTLDWLLANKDRTDYTFFWGNHDLPYAYPFERLMCSGHNWSTRKVLAQHPEIWERFILTEMVNGVQVSHAGFTPETGYGDIDRRCHAAIAGLKGGHIDALLQAGQSRGGRQDVGGCTWLDWEDEFRPIEGIPQIVGHSRGKEPRWNGNSVCIDTELNHYAVIDGGEILVYDLTGAIMSLGQ